MRFKYGSAMMRLTARGFSHHLRRSRWYATSSSSKSPGWPVVQSCPDPACGCREMPPGLDIDQKQDLNGTMPAYAEQILISTGKSDWTSKIEDDADGELVRYLKSYIGPRGKYSNPFHNVLLTHSSFSGEQTASSLPTEHTSSTSSASSASAYLFPSFQYIPTIPLQPAATENFVKAFVLPTDTSSLPDNAVAQHTIALRQPELQASFQGVKEVDEVLVLICSHGTRDSRCGILGPILRDEFIDKLQRAGITTNGVSRLRSAQARPEGTPSVRVGLISHVGGHKWAANVILYIPPRFQTNKLAGSGIWYGRAEPKHVEGIIKETILGGRIIQDMFRGGITRDRSIIRL